MANRSRESGERVAGEFEIPTVYESWLELIRADDTDAICIGTWPYMHKTLTLAALENEKHVLCEARMAMNAREAREMLDASRQKPHLVTQIVPAPATLEADATIHDYIANGYLGEILAVRLRVANTEGRSAPGDTFADYDSPLHWRQDRDLSGYNAMSMGIWYEQVMALRGSRHEGHGNDQSMRTTTRRPERARAVCIGPRPYQRNLPDGLRRSSGPQLEFGCWAADRLGALAFRLRRHPAP